MENLTTSQRITNFRQYSADLEKVACRTAHGFKMAAAEMISLKNRLNNPNLGTTFSCIRPSALEHTLRRSQQDLLQNKSALISSSLTKSMCYDRSASKTGGKEKGGCARCKDKFGLDASVYSTHRANSSKCPTAEIQSPEKRKMTRQHSVKCSTGNEPSRKKRNVDSSMPMETATTAVLSRKKKKVEATMEKMAKLAAAVNSAGQ